MAQQWTDEKVEKLKTLWLSGQYSARGVAEEVGMSRGACTGKLHRLGLMNSRTPARSSILRNSPGYVKPAPKPRKLPPPELPALILEDGKHVDLETVSDLTCRWPIGLPDASDFHFCGHAVKERGPYCPAHEHKAHDQSQVVKYKSPYNHTAKIELRQSFMQRTET